MSLQKEVSSLVGDSQNLTFADRERMPYTYACLLETTRLDIFLPLQAILPWMTWPPSLPCITKQENHWFFFTSNTMIFHYISSSFCWIYFQYVTLLPLQNMYRFTHPFMKASDVWQELSLVHILKDIKAHLNIIWKIHTCSSITLAVNKFTLHQCFTPQVLMVLNNIFHGKSSLANNI